MRRVTLSTCISKCGNLVLMVNAFENGSSPGKPLLCYRYLNIFSLECFPLENFKEASVRSKLGDMNLVSSFRRTPRGRAEQNQFDSLVELVRSVTLVPMADRWIWKLDLSTVHFLKFPENSIGVLKLMENSVEVLKILENKLESMRILENKFDSLKL
ncbi:hypothetical protein Tco_0305284 [Tanacetum coccineum]